MEGELSVGGSLLKGMKVGIEAGAEFLGQFPTSVSGGLVYVALGKLVLGLRSRAE